MALICFDAGHGGADSGAVGKERSYEKNHVLDIALIAGNYAISFGHKVIYTRNKDIFIPLSDRAEMANKKNCDIFVSIHCNAAISSSANGTETFYFPGSKKGEQIAKEVQNELIKELQLRNRGIKTARFAVIRLTDMPAILVEVAFISNLREEQLLKKSDFRKSAAKAIVDGINAYLGIKPNPVPMPTSVELDDKDTKVLDIQKILNRLNIRDYKNRLLEEDNIMGPLTESSIRKFQSIMNLNMDGIWGEKTENSAKSILDKPMLLENNKYNIVTRYVQYRIFINIDGIFGPKTKARVVEWQKSNGLIGDGIVGPNTWKEMIG